MSRDSYKNDISNRVELVGRHASKRFRNSRETGKAIDLQPNLRIETIPSTDLSIRTMEI